MENAEKRFYELAGRAEERFYNTFSDFLNMEEQSRLASIKLQTPFCLFGGYDGAERCVAVFGDGCESAEAPVKAIRIEPLSKKVFGRADTPRLFGNAYGARHTQRNAGRHCC